jgi:hypothetical protein
VRFLEGKYFAKRQKECLIHSMYRDCRRLRREQSRAEEEVAEKVISRSEVVAEKGRKFVPVVARDSSVPL